jgi:hypothetical protein
VADDDPAGFTITETGNSTNDDSAVGPLIRWASVASGNWSTPTNWNPQQVPTADDSVVIDFTTSVSNPTLSLDNVTLQNYATDVTQLSITYPGGTDYSFTGLTLDSLTGGNTMFYVSATDPVANGSSFTLTIATDPSNGSSFTYINDSGASDTPVVVWQ